MTQGIITPDQRIQTIAPGQMEQMKRIMADGWKMTPATCAHKLSGGKWQAARHLKYISTIIATEIAKGDARIIVTMPARHGKSEFLSVNTPVWFLEKWPHKYVMNLSYGADLATGFSFRVRQMFLEEELHHLLSTRLNKKKLKMEHFLTMAGGGVTAAGIGGTITGRGADLLLIDDYIKNAEEALSENENNKIWEWFKSTAYTRLEPGGSIIVLATRWSQNDLIEHLVTEMAHENWIVIRLPALAEENDPLGREVGEALWPERYTKERLEAIRQSVGSYWWSAMYQQDPKASMAGMDLGEQLQTIPWSEVPYLDHMKLIRTWDFASTENAGDWTAGPKMAYDKKSGRTIILDIEDFQKSPLGLETRVNEVALDDGAGIPIWIEQEPGSAGVIVIEHFRREVLSGFSTNGEKPTGKIEIRATPLLADIEHGKVVTVPGPWVTKLKAQLNGFPDAIHDDMISALALGHKHLNAHKYGSATFGRGQKDSVGNIVRMKRSHENPHMKSTRGVTFGRRRRSNG